MGRTNPTFRDFLERYEDAFGEYRRALRRRPREDFDHLFARAREFADAGGYANHCDRDTVVLLSMLLAHERALREREERLADLEGRVAALENESDGGRAGDDRRRADAEEA